MELVKSNEIYNVAGGFEQSNIDTIKKIIDAYFESSVNYDDYISYDVMRPGQDVRYAIDDSKLKNLGWSPQVNFDNEILNIVNYYKNKFIW